MSSNSASDFEFPRGKSLPKKSPGATHGPARPVGRPRSQPIEDFSNDLEGEIFPETKEKTETSSSTEQSSSAPEYPEEELLRVFDEILFSNEYSETFSIRGRMEVTFRTRTAKEVQDIDKSLDSLGASLISTVENLRSFKHLERALVSYNGKDLSTLRVSEKESFVQALPGPIIGALLITLAKFDHKIGMACRVGEQNF